MAKKKVDSSVGFVEPSMSLVLGVKEGEWKEIKQYRDEGIFFQIGSSLCTFAMSLIVTLLTCKIEEIITEKVLWAVFGASLGIGIILLYLWFREKKKKNNVVKRVESRAREKFGDDIDL